ncbi:methylaspartate ammonia-lyase [Arthrobacter sp. GAS37]|uniref:methylaspartate ammonia-lyase n=1 Tax=Arthrobacter sp. GAS37 TaxID=3156261 RepID=UPI003835A51D
MKIIDVLCVPVRTGFYRDDQAAIRADATHDGFLYEGRPLTPGFSAIREPGTAVSVMLILSDGQVALGDCAEVQYAGAGGRAPVFGVDEALAQIRQHIAPTLIGRPVTGFRELAEETDSLRADGQPLAAAVRYGVTQALLHAAALAAGLTMAEVVQHEYDTDVPLLPVPLYAQTGDDRYTNVDKMILKEVDVLPHGLINQVDTKLGAGGGLLKNYVRWLRERILTTRARPEYAPRLHLDTYGTIGIEFDQDLDRIARYLDELAVQASPFKLRIEHPIDAGSRDGQVNVYTELRRMLAARGIPVDLVVDEWCNTREDIEAFVSAGAADVIHVKTPDLGGINNTIEALLYVRRHGLAAYCGGTCNETDISARVSAHIAMACGADQVLAKPGMGVDEGLMIVGNEMARTAALARSRAASGRALSGAGDGVR